MVILSSGFLSCLNLLQLFVTWYWMRLIECWTTDSNPLSEPFCPSARPVSVPVTLSKLVIGRFYSFSFLVISICKELVILAASTNSISIGSDSAKGSCCRCSLVDGSMCTSGHSGSSSSSSSSSMSTISSSRSSVSSSSSIGSSSSSSSSSSGGSRSSSGGNSSSSSSSSNSICSGSNKIILVKNTN